MNRHGQVELARDVNFTSQSIALGAALARNDITAVLSEGTECTLNGFYLVNGTQHVDTHTAIDHAKPHGTSHELYKGILGGRANAVFNGKILVRKDAQKQIEQLNKERNEYLKAHAGDEGGFDFKVKATVEKQLAKKK